MLLSNKETKEIESILDSKLILEFFEIGLTQMKQNIPRKYRGPGSIWQDSDGFLRLKMYHKYVTNDEEMTEINGALGGNDLAVGEIIGEDHYFSLEAKDTQGRIWKEEGVWVTGNLDSRAAGRVIDAKLQQITAIADCKTQEDKAKLHVSAIVQDGYRLPYNEIDETEAKSTRNICKLNVCGETCEIRKRKNNLEISAAIPSAQKAEQYSNLLVQALSIGTGNFLYPLVQVISAGGKRITSIYARKSDGSSAKLLTPFPLENPHGSTNLEAFVSKYITKIGEPYSPIFGYWFRILGESSGELENMALVLTTCIEGTIKKYYPDYGLPDSEFLGQVTEAIEILKTSHIEKRAKDRILSTLNSAKKPSTKNALREFAKNGVISESLVNIWVRLRNKSAHADQLKRNKQELQKFLDDVHGAHELFYVLLLFRVGYEGEYFQYSKGGWPVSSKVASA